MAVELKEEINLRSESIVLIKHDPEPCKMVSEAWVPTEDELEKECKNDSPNSSSWTASQVWRPTVEIKSYCREAIK